MDDVDRSPDELVYFDAFASFGPYPNKPAEARWTLAHLLSDLDLAGIAGALVTYTQSLHYDPMFSNRRLVERIDQHRDRLAPCWVALPDVGGDVPSADEFVREMREHDVRAVRVEPGHFGVPVDEYVWEPLRDALAAEGTLIVTTADPERWDRVEGVLDVFSDNPVLLADAVWSQWRRVAALMERYDNLHVEFSAFQANRAIEHFAERFGAERCLFGTGLPRRAPGCGRGMLDWSLLSRESVELVAGGNLRRLLGGQGPAEPPAPTEWHDEIAAATRRGDPLPCQTLDAHCHVLHPGGNAAGAENVMLDGGPDGMYELATRFGVDRTAVMSWAGPLSMDTALGNRIVAEAVDRYPDHFVGLSTINPTHDDPEDVERVIDTYHREKGWPGIKTYAPRQGFAYDDPVFERYFEFANDHGLYAVVDPAGIPPDDQVANLARTYPDMGIHLDHCGRSWAYAKWAVSVAERFENVWLQLNFTAATNGVVEYLVEAVGAERVLWGTDAPMRDPRPQAAWLSFTRLSREEKEMIFGGNFAAVLGDVGVGV